MRRLGVLLVLLVAALSAAQDSQPEQANVPLTADAVMARVAANQDRSEALRKQYVYRQHIHILTHKPNGRVLREETADYDVVPTPDGTQKELKLLTGRYWNKGSTRRSRESPFPIPAVSMAVWSTTFARICQTRRRKTDWRKTCFP